ncbi:Gfo/Idh/MocA family oxidoreductase [bacterium]|nr:Gfo/Idh/MocA family oxidoreductase [bacterium]
MNKNTELTRRKFLANSAKTAGGLTAGAVMSTMKPGRVLGANDRIVMAVIGIRSRGNQHYREWTNIPNVEVKTLCDIDENLFGERVKEVEKLQGKKPLTEYDLRKVLDDKEIDAVSIATTDHWHALATIWACQAGKHVYVEKPTSHNIWEGRKMVEAARKYNRIVAAGTQNRSIRNVRKAMEFLHQGGIGKVYMAKGLCFKPRDSIGRKQECPVPPGVHYDLWLGPAPWRPFNPNRFHYNWHWFWDYGCTDLGNQGPHQMDIARWGLNKSVYPRKIKCVGGYFAFDSDQETPNTQLSTLEYEDGTILQFEVRGLYTNGEADVRIGNLFYGSEGWMYLNGSTWKTYFGRENTPGPSSDDIAEQSKAEESADPMNLAGAGGEGHFANFIYALRTNNWMNLTGDIQDGHLSTALCHLSNISNRLGRELTFDSQAERFVGDDIADSYLTRNYRYPYVVPEKV